MDHIEPTAPADASPDPQQDSPATTRPTNIDIVLHAVRILLGYGRHLVDTVRQRATVAPSFNAVAANFGTGNLTTILAHLNRGILRCIALERILLARAATGRDIDIIERNIWTTVEPEPDPAETPQSDPTEAPQPEQPGAAAAEPLPIAERKRVPRPVRPNGWNDPEFFMPTLEDLERQMRRRPIGRIILDISLDLAVVPGLCHPAFWDTLSEIMTHFGSGGIVAQLMREKARRRQAFDKEQDRDHNANWDWIKMSREALRQALGFFIGEPPVNPLDPAAAIATAPP